MVDSYGQEPVTDRRQCKLERDALGCLDDQFFFGLDYVPRHLRGIIKAGGADCKAFCLSIAIRVLYTYSWQDDIAEGPILKTDLHRGPLSADKFRFAVVVSRWNDELTSRLRDGAIEALTECGTPSGSISVYTVPGSFELPLACMKAAETGKFDAVIALGVVIRGGTPHFDFVAGQTASGLMSASLATETPILFGVITADTEQQAAERSGTKENNKGYEAALSAVEMAVLLRNMSSDKDQGWGEKVLPHVV